MKPLTARSGMMLALQVSVLALLLDQPLNLSLLVALAAGYWLAGGGLGHWRIMALVLMMGTWGIVFSQALFYGGMPRTVLVTLADGAWFPFGSPPGLYLYREGFLHGLLQSLRVDTVLLMGAGLLGRYAADEMVAGLRALRVPAPLAFLFSLALRFVPLLAAELRAIWTAQRLRGLRFFHGGLWKWPITLMRGGRAIVLPLIAATVRKSDEVSAALVSRGLSPHDVPRVGYTRRETVLWSSGATVLALLLTAQILTQLYRAGVFARPWLNWLYDTVIHHV